MRQAAPSLNDAGLGNHEEFTFAAEQDGLGKVLLRLPPYARVRSWRFWIAEIDVLQETLSIPISKSVARTDLPTTCSTSCRWRNFRKRTGSTRETVRISLTTASWLESLPTPPQRFISEAVNLPERNSIRTRLGWAEPEVVFRIVHVALASGYQVDCTNECAVDTNCLERFFADIRKQRCSWVELRLCCRLRYSADAVEVPLPAQVQLVADNRGRRREGIV